jgi:hypothetical protein
MLYDQQELYFGPNFDYCADERNGYLCPIDICEDQHTFRIGDDNDELEGLEGEERVEKIRKLKLDFESKYTFYIGNALKMYQYRKAVVAPYHFW